MRFYKQQLIDYFIGQREQGSLWLLWFLLLPLVPLIAYMSLGLLRILPSTDLIPRHIYIVLGMTSWLLLSEGLMRPAQSLQSRRGYFIRKEASLLAVLTAWIPERLMTLLLQVTFCLTVSWVYLPFGLQGVATFALILLAGLILFTTLGVVVAIVGLVSPSFSKLLETANRFLLFLSAVIFPLPSNPFVDQLKVLNPYHLFIDNARSGLFALPVDWIHIGYWMAGALLLLSVLYKRTEVIAPDVREYLQ